MNSGGQDYGGGGVWIGGAGHSTFSHNNDIVGNSSTLTGGGVRVFGGTMTGHSNIIWGNRANSGAQQVAGTSTSANLDYCCVQGGWSGDGNINVYPEFLANLLILAPSSPCIDTGNPDAEWNDQDGTRCDMGYLGGQSAEVMPNFGGPVIYMSSSYVPFTGEPRSAWFKIENRGTTELHIDSVLISSGDWFELGVVPTQIPPVWYDSLQVISLNGGDVTVYDTLLVYHNDATSQYPLRRAISDEGTSAGEPVMLPSSFEVLPAFPNPFNSSTTLRVALPEEQRVTISIYDVLGREVDTVADDIYAPGYHSFVWDAKGAASGSYVARVIAGEHIEEVVLRYIK
jgi:hypothetical protein